MIYRGDLFDVLPTLPEASVDACVTDPPYELGFMGKAWDGRGVAFQLDTWRQVLHVLKPGAHLVAFGGTRTFHRLTCAIEDAGFEIRDCLSWLYGSGFPKSLDVSKAIDAAAGVAREGGKSGGGGPFADTGRCVFCGRQYFSGSPCQCPRTDRTPSTDAAKQWQGWGTALKPSWEPVILARKPFAGTVAANVIEHGTAALNIDGCRIEADWDSDPTRRGWQGGDATNSHSVFGNSGAGRVSQPNDLGRWPSNVLLDEEAAAMLDAQTGELAPPGGLAKGVYRSDGGVVDFGTTRSGPQYLNETGGASRFYYVAKPSREERDYGCEGLTLRQRDESRKDGNPGGYNPRNRGLQPCGNFHPTVKPVELMRWLVKLVTPPGGTVLDPFMGSGTTGMACRYELREFIGIEREAEYVAIAEQRIAACVPLFGGEAQDADGTTG